MFEFQWPWLFWLSPLPVLVYLFSKPAATGAALRVPFFDRLQSLGDAQHLNKTSANPWWRLLLLLLIWLALLAGAARPVWIGQPITLETSGRDLMLAVDISGSMRQEDMVIQDEALPRITVVKAVVKEFIRQRSGDRLGLILFGSQAYIQSPLSFDLNTLGTLMDEAQVGFAGKQTAIGDAIGFAIKRLRDRPSDSRVVVLLTDGADTASNIDPIQAAKLAAAEQVKIYTIGVGATEMKVPGIFGSNFGARTVNPSADLDEASLKAIADTTGGQYFRARNPQELQQAYQAIAELEPIEQEGETLRPTRSLLQWPLLFAAGAMGLLALFSRLGRSR
jgi:Ca-activated chloride channel family protein